MASGEGITLTMDVDQFKNAIASVMKGFSGMEGGMNKFSSGMVAKGMIIAQAIIGMAKSAFGFLKNALTTNIPEIGKTFEIASDIIMRNLLWPLRKELLPILQKVLNWVRDHRIMFVQMGTVIVSVFRTIKTVIMAFVNTFQKIWEAMSARIEAIFGKSTMSIMDLMNVVLFKISAVVIFMEQLLEPIFIFIGEQIGNLIYYFQQLGEGIMSTTGDITANLEDVFVAFRDIGKMIKEVLGDTDAMGKAFKVLGQVLGLTIKPILAMIGEYLQMIAGQIDGVVTAVKWAKAKLSGNDKDADEAWQGFKGRQGDRFQRSQNRWGDVADNTVKGVGKIKDTVTSSNVDNSQNVNIVVNGSTNPKETGKEVANELRSLKERQGAKR